MRGVQTKLVQKSKERPPWSPDFDSILSSKKASSIIQNYFQKQTKTLSFSPTFQEYPHRTLSGLPCSRDLQRILSGKHLLYIYI